MLRQYALIEKIKGYNPKADIGLINRAYVYSMKAHGNQKRASGEPYLNHPLAVAEVLADMKLDDSSIAVGLLHDTLEDTLSTYDELEKLFGKEVAELTDGVTKLSRVSFEDKNIEQAENFRKLLLAMSKDIRVLLIKLADRLHNMRTLAAKKAESQRKTARETLDIYVPLADRIGLHVVKAELEDLAFAVLDPDAYETLDKRMQTWREQDELVPRVMTALKEELKKAGIEAEVTGREKAVYSIYQKMVRKSLAFDQLTDIVAYRIVVEDKRGCYEVLGLLHDRFKAVPGRFKDYISAPKPNGYQSLHTSVIGPFGSRMEIQIRTQEMHDVAENGLAAHWLYKPSASGKVKVAPDAVEPRSSPYRWLMNMIDQLQGLEDPEEFYEHAKLELFSENVFAFTPKGDLIQLPRGATPLDFAYAVHSNVGHKTVSAKVNGAMVPLRRQLENGDMVEIITSANQQPNPGWREIAVSSRARAAINRYLRQQQSVEQIRIGRDILEKAAKRDGWHWAEADVQKILKKIPVACAKVEDVFEAIGQGRLFPRQIHELLFPGAYPETPATKKPSRKTKKGEADATVDEGVVLEGITAGLAVHYAKCCSPLPGEEIVGIVTTGRGLTIHMRTCKNLEALADQPDRWLPVSWSKAAVDGKFRQFICRIRFYVKNEPNALASLTTAIAGEDANIIYIASEHRTIDAMTVRCEMEIRNKEHLNHLLQNLSALKSVMRVEKIYAWT